MAGTFIGHLNDAIARKREALKVNLHSGRRIDDELRAAVLQHWHMPLPPRVNGAKRPAFAIDGSSRRAHLTNGSTVFVAQALIMGEAVNEPITDIEILPGTVRPQTMDRFADLMRQWLEISLAREYAAKIPRGAILYLDGALYGTLPQLYPLKAEGIPEDRDYASMLVEEYRALFALCEERDIQLISIAKTNRQPLFSKILQRRLGREGDAVQEISDSALFDELTERRSGFSTPIVLGTYSFSEGAASVVIEREGVKEEPAIVSFFVRLADLDDALRIDVPASCLGRPERIGQLEVDWLPPEAVVPVIQLLQSDYGGIQVYNALAYVTDLEVRLTKQKMYDIYLPLIAEMLGEEIRIDRSERRFVE